MTVAEAHPAPAEVRSAEYIELRLSAGNTDSAEFVELRLPVAERADISESE